MTQIGVGMTRMTRFIRFAGGIVGTGALAGLLAYPAITGAFGERASAGASQTQSQSGDPAFDADYQKFVAWMKVNYPNVDLGGPILASKYHVEYLEQQPNTVVQTADGAVQASTGKVLAPPGAAFIGSKYQPNANRVRQCQQDSSSSDECGFWLAVASGKLDLSHGPHPYLDGSFWTHDELANAIAAAGYAGGKK